jgi:hypothetical protein
MKMLNGKMQRTSNVLYISNLKRSLLSVCQIAKKNLKVEFNTNKCVIRDKENCYVLQLVLRKLTYIGILPEQLNNKH